MTIATGVLVNPGIARIARRNCRPLVSGIRMSRMIACGTMRLGQGQAFVRRVRRPHLIAFEAKHPRKRIGDADVVVDDQDTSGRGVGGVKDTAHCGARPISRQDGGNRRAIFTRFAHAREVPLSPILVRPVREQLEHDRVIRLLQAKYKRKFEVAINPGNEQTVPVLVGPRPVPDLVLQSNRARAQGAGPSSRSRRRNR